MEATNHLGHLADEVREKGGLTVEWVMLRNLYFRGDDPVGQIKTWAKSEGLHASFDCEEECITPIKIRSVYFYPRRSAT